MIPYFPDVGPLAQSVYMYTSGNSLLKTDLDESTILFAICGDTRVDHDSPPNSNIAYRGRHTYALNFTDIDHFDRC